MNKQQMRDDLARQTYNMAMQHFMAEFPRQTSTENDNTVAFIAKLSYRAADAMMAERAK